MKKLILFIFPIILISCIGTEEKNYELTKAVNEYNRNTQIYEYICYQDSSYVTMITIVANDEFKANYHRDKILRSTYGIEDLSKIHYTVRKINIDGRQPISECITLYE